MSWPEELWLRLTMLESRARGQQMTKADQKWFLKEGRGASLAPPFYFSFKRRSWFPTKNPQISLSEVLIYSMSPASRRGLTVDLPHPIQYMQPHLDTSRV